MDICLVTLIFYGFQFLELVEASVNVSLARGKPTMQSNDYKTYTSDLAVDGGYNSTLEQLSCSHAWTSGGSWWTVDLQDVFTIDRLVIYNRDAVQNRMDNLHVEVFVMGDPYLCPGHVKPCGFNPGPSGDVVTVDCPNNTIARYIRLRGQSGLTFCEVDVFGQATSRCEQWNMKIKSGRKLVEFFRNLGPALTPMDCVYLCQRRNKICNVFNYNVVDGTCMIPTIPIRQSSLAAHVNWNIYYTC